MDDTLTITDLELWTHIGVPKEERATEQRLLVTVGLTVDTRAAAKSDDVKKSINYIDVADDVKALAQKERKTIERFAEDIAIMILKNYGTPSVTVTIKKFAIPGSASVALTIERSQ